MLYNGPFRVAYSLMELSRWKYSLFLAIDVNFHLACKNVSSDKADPGLNKGWAYFIEEKAFKRFLHDTGKQPQEVQDIYLTHITLAHSLII